ncbi:NAD(P)-dependent oxidoreductase [Brachybacterium sp. AOP42-C2-15]|uniref:NAD(P)-dependent oxidoreductase n=1 Tax=unclassified Brachybacterium TaxID=2623841 RepID=UPI003F8F1BEA
MKITVIGVSTGTGALLASLAHEQGHEVTALSRRGAAPAGARALSGDALAPGIAAEAVAGADAVVVTVGGAKGVPHQRAAVTRAVVTAMQAAGARRLVVQSSLGAGDSGSQLPGIVGWAMKTLLAKPLADHDEQESAVVESGLDWTLVRPTGLTNGPASGAWRALEPSEQGTLRGSISRSDLAALLLDVLADDSTIGRKLGVSAR